MPEIDVRLATVADCEAVDRLQTKAFPGDVLLMTKAEMEDRCTGRKDGVLLVATCDEAVAAYVVLTNRRYRPWTGWDFLAVDPAFSRLGIAGRLTEEVFRRASRPLIRGFVREYNHSALALYRRYGFIQTGRRFGHYSTGEDAIVLLGQTLVPIRRRVLNGTKMLQAS